MKKLNPVGQMAASYSKQPLIQALAKFIPGAGPLDTLLKALAQEIAEDRAKVFFEELESGQLEFTPELIQSEDFVHRFVITAKAAVNTRRREKVRLFARLLRSSLQEESPVDADQYEEYLAILDDLSYREFVILSTLEKYEAPHRSSLGEDPLKKTSHYWNDFFSEMQSRFDLSKEDLFALLSRLNRTGCYMSLPGAMGVTIGDRGQLKDIYFKLKSLIDSGTASS